MSSVTVALVHAHPIFREGLRQTISTFDGFEVVGEAGNGQEGIQLVDHTSPSILLMTVDLIGVSGLEVARAVKRTHPEVCVVLLGDLKDHAAIIKAIRAGVSAYVPHKVTPEVLMRTLKQVDRGEYPINDMVLSNPDVAEEVLRAFRQLALDETDSAVYSPMTPRELEVLELVAAGRTNKEIAAQLDISNQTVKNHVSSILRKLAVNDRTQAVVYAMRRGWIKVVLPGDV